MQSLSRLALLLAIAAPLHACAAEEAPYDPDADSELAIAGGKADGIFDIIPEIAFDTDETGSIADDDVEFYRIDLQRTDQIRVIMETSIRMPRSTMEQAPISGRIAMTWGTTRSPSSTRSKTPALS